MVASLIPHMTLSLSMSFRVASKLQEQGPQLCHKHGYRLTLLTKMAVELVPLHVFRQGRVVVLRHHANQLLVHLIAWFRR